MSEEYSIGFQEGYQSGWNSALEAAPPQRQPLTDEQIKRLHSYIEFGVTGVAFGIALARAVETAHGIGDKT